MTDNILTSDAPVLDLTTDEVPSNDDVVFNAGVTVAANRMSPDQESLYETYTKFQTIRESLGDDAAWYVMRDDYYTAQDRVYGEVMDEAVATGSIDEGVEVFGAIQEVRAADQEDIDTAWEADALVCKSMGQFDQDVCMDNLVKRMWFDGVKDTSLGDTILDFAGMVLPDFTWEAAELGDVPIWEGPNTLENMIHWYNTLSHEERVKVTPSLVKQIREVTQDFGRENQAKYLRFAELFMNPENARDGITTDVIFDAMSAFGAVEAKALVQGVFKVGSKYTTTRHLKELGANEELGRINAAAISDGTGAVEEATGISRSTAVRDASPFKAEGYYANATDGVAHDIQKQLEGIEEGRRELAKALDPIIERTDILDENLLSVSDMHAAQLRGITNVEDLLTQSQKDKGWYIDNASITNADNRGFGVSYDMFKDDGSLAFKVDGRRIHYTLNDSTGDIVTKDVALGPISSRFYSPETWIPSMFNRLHEMATRINFTQVKFTEVLHKAADAAVKNLSTRQRRNIDALLIQGDEANDGLGKVYTLNDFQKGIPMWDAKKGREVDMHFSENEIQAYYKLRDMFDALHFLRNRQVRESLIAQNYRDVTFVDGSKGIGKVQTTIPAEVRTNGFRIYDERAGGLDGTGNLEKAYEDGYRLVKLRDSARIGDEYVDYALLSPENIRELPYNVTHYKAGYVPRDYVDGYYFVHKIVDSVKNGKPQKHKTTVRTFDNSRDAEAWTKRQQSSTKIVPQRIKNLYVSGREADTNKILANLPEVKTGYTRLYKGSSPSQNFEDVFNAEDLTDLAPGSARYWTDDISVADYYRDAYNAQGDAVIEYMDFPTSKLASTKSSDGYLIDLEEVNKTRTDPRNETYVVARDRENILEMEQGYIDNSGGLYYSPRGLDALRTGLTDEGEDAVRASALEALGRNMQNIGTHVPLAEFRLASQNDWVKLANRLDALENPQNASFNSALKAGLDPDKKRALETSRNWIKDQLRIPTDHERAWQKTLWNFAEALEGYPILKKPSKLIMDLGSKDPFAALRAASFHAHLGWLNPAQYWVQSQGAAIAFSLDPVNSLKYFRQYHALRAAYYAENAPKAIQLTAKAAGIDPKQAEIMLDGLRRTGLMDAVNKQSADYAASTQLHAKDLGWGTFGTMVNKVRTGLRTAANKSLVLFNEGERFTRGYAFTESFNRFMKTRTKTGKLTDDELKVIMDGTLHRMLNLTRANRAHWQKGVWSVPTQFMQFSAKFLEAMIPNLGLNMRRKVGLHHDKFSSSEWRRIMMGQMALYGAAGVPFGMWLAEEIAEMQGVDINQLSDKERAALTDGFWGWASEMSSGTSLELGTRGAGWSGTELALEGVYNMFTNKVSVKDTMLGAFGGVGTKAFDAMMFSAPVVLPFTDVEMTSKDLAIAADYWGDTISSWRSWSKAYAIYKTGTIRDKHGNALVVPDDPSMTAVWRALGFTSKSEADVWKINKQLINRKEQAKQFRDGYTKLLDDYYSPGTVWNEEEMRNFNVRIQALANWTGMLNIDGTPTLEAERILETARIKWIDDETRLDKIREKINKSIIEGPDRGAFKGLRFNQNYLGEDE